MLTRFFGKEIHNRIHLFALFLLTVGITCSIFIMSISTMLLLLNILLEGKYGDYVRNLRLNRNFHYLLLVFLLFPLGLIYSIDKSEGFGLIKSILPLLIIPMCLCAKPITDIKTIHSILKVFILSILVTSLINFAAYQHWILNVVYDDIRGLSLFGSHIRYGVLVSLAALFSLNFLRHISKNRLFYLSVGAWLIFYTIYSQIISGFLTLIAGFVFLSILVVYRYKKLLVIPLVLVYIACISVLIYLIIPKKESQIEVDSLPKYTANGNLYKHDLNLIGFEDGERIFTHINDEELEKEWEKLSKIPFDGMDRDGSSLKSTLIRYLTSKKLTKDSVGVHTLTDTDISHIENGIASIKYTRPGLFGRLASVSFQIQNNTNPNGHSLLQRLHYWQASWDIIKENWFIGIGTGSGNKTFNKHYEKTNSPLDPELRLRSHNQFLTFWVNFGIIGIILFIFFLLKLFYFNFKQNQIFGLLTLIVFITSFLTEDTLETQMGVTSFALFIGIFMNKLTPIKASQNL